MRGRVGALFTENPVMSRCKLYPVWVSVIIKLGLIRRKAQREVKGFRLLLRIGFNW